MLYKNIDSLWINALHKLAANGHRTTSRNGETREIVGYHARLSGTRTFLLNPRRRLSPTYACAELIWYLSRDNLIDGIVAYAPQYEKFANDGVALGAYGARWWQNFEYRDQFNYILRILQEHPDSRQAIVTMWNASPDLERALTQSARDIPCTINWQFLIRNARLHMICNMRSQDVWLGLPYDVYVNTCIQRLLASKLEVGVGTYTHNCGSLHLYSKHFAAAAEATDCAIDDTDDLWFNGEAWDCHTEVCSIEEDLRYNRIVDVYQTIMKGRFHGILSDALFCVSTKWGYNSERYIESPRLRKAIQNANSRRS